MRPIALRETDLTRFAEACNQLTAGRSDNGGTFTLTAGATSTVVSRPGVAPLDCISLMPTTANAAAALATTYINPGIDTFTVTHSNTATVDRTFRFTFVATTA